MGVRLSLDHFLAANNITAYRLAKETEGKVARASIYAMARGDKVMRVDLDNLYHVLNALSALTGREVTIKEVFEVELDSERQLRLSGAGVPYTGHKETDDVLDEHPDILERRDHMKDPDRPTYSLEEAFSLHEDAP